jgi:hypothetical protein
VLPPIEPVEPGTADRKKRQHTEQVRPKCPMICRLRGVVPLHASKSSSPNLDIQP